ncbi:hypothetical protein ACLOJK_030974 [Asimina triloba]
MQDQRSGLESQPRQKPTRSGGVRHTTWRVQYVCLFRKYNDTLSITIIKTYPYIETRRYRYKRL